MRGIRRDVGWFAAAVLAAFIAGAGVGLAWPVLVDALWTAAPETEDEAYIRELGQRYRLTPKQIREVRMVLEAKRLSYGKILAQHFAGLPETVQDEVHRAEERAEKRIKWVLTAAQRQQFLQDSELAPAMGADQDGPVSDDGSKDH